MARSPWLDDYILLGDTNLVANLLDILLQMLRGQSTDETKWTNPPATTAMTRFTHTPVYIGSQKDAPEGMGRIAGAKQDPVTGVDRDDNKIGIYTTPHSTYPQLQQVLKHEQIHALLQHLVSGPGKNNGADQPPWSPPGGDAMIDAFRSGSRDGSPTMELPAYLGAFQSGQIPGVTQPQATQTMQDFSSQLPPDISALLQRIMRSQVGGPQ